MIRHSLGEVENTLRECPKCHRQNQPTRKYCTRCGANLIQPIEEEKPIPEPIPTEDTVLVRPSKVETDRVIPPERHVEKTELEKAQETFSRADGAGIEEESGAGIVEPRMLRASEVRELMDSVEGLPESVPTQPSETPESPETTAPSMPTPEDIERGILGAKSEFVEKPEPIPEPPQPIVEPIATPEVPVSPEPAPEIAPLPESKPVPTVEVVATDPPQDVTADMWEYESKIPDKEYLGDVGIKGPLSDLKHLLIELKQVTSDLNSCRSRQDETVQQYRNTAEVKRINYESLQEQAKHAKNEWNDAEKEFRRAEDRRKKEVSSIEKRIDKIQKQIKKGESSMEKRVRELDKEKEKLAQEKAKKT